MERLHVIYKGIVQGVWFRANCRKKAIELGLVGWVRNLPDGSVESVAEGSRENLQKLLKWCSNDQPHARVREADARWEKYLGEFEGFSIIR
ncbi:MAG: acylphosphatase [Candidatus Thermoplasmatota archaeon]|nr:acylphosphatase [Candidatus Thermoplasmatota archaeon]